MINLDKQRIMAAVQKRESLHEYIDTADEEKIEAIYIILKDSMPADYQYSEYELVNIYARRNKYKNSEEQLLTVEGLINYVRQNKL